MRSLQLDVPPLRRAVTWVAAFTALLAFFGGAPAQAADAPPATVTITPVGDWYETLGGAPNQFRVDVTTADGSPATAPLGMAVDDQLSMPVQPGTVVSFDGAVTAGVHTLRAYYGSAPGRPGVQATAQVTVLAATAPSAVTFSAPTSVAFGQDFPVSIDVTAAGAPAVGSVELDLDGAGRMRAVLTGGHADVTAWRSPWPSPGNHQFTVRYLGGGGAQEATSAAQPETITPLAFTALRKPVVTGTPVQAATLSVSTTGLWSPAPAFVIYQWFVGGVAVAGQTGAQFVVPGSAKGKAVTVRVTAHSDGYTIVSQTSAAVVIRDASTQIQCQAHVQSIGWQSWTAGGGTAGTMGRSLRIEALRFKLVGAAYSGGITAKAQVQNVGWMPAVSNGGVVGTTGRGLRLEAVTLQLTGEMARHYDIYYQGYLQLNGWRGWVSDGELGGTEGAGLRLEALQVRLVPKDSPPPGPTAQGGLARTLYDVPDEMVTTEAHVQNIGWMAGVPGGQIAGTTGQGLRLEALRFTVDSAALTGGIIARGHVQNLGWMAPVGSGGLVGTTGQGLRLEAVTLQLTGDMAGYYDLHYRTHVQNFGWLGWATNGEQAGSAGYGYRMEAIEVRVVPKFAPGPWDVWQQPFEQR